MSEHDVFFLLDELSRLERDMKAGGSKSELLHKITRREAIKKILQEVTDGVVTFNWRNRSNWSAFEI